MTATLKSQGAGAIYEVPSSDGSRNYRVALVLNDDGLQAVCNCTAGHFDRECKHAKAAAKAWETMLSEKARKTLTAVGSALRTEQFGVSP